MEPVEIDFMYGGNTETEGAKIEKSLDDITTASKKAQADVVASAKEQASVIKQIEADIKSLEKQISKAAPGNSQQALVQELAYAKRALDEEKAALNSVNESIDTTASAHVRLRTRVMEAKDELAKMEMAGKRGTPEYNAMAKNLGELADQMSDTTAQTKILADDEKGFKGVASAVSGVAGAMSAGVGAAALFGAENEDLVKIQTRLQAVMAITIGIQQVAETLNKDSYFSVVLLARGKDFLTASTTRLSVALGISNGAAKALMATMTLGLTVAIGAIIYLWDQYSTKQKKVADESKEFGKKTADAFGEPMAKVQLLSDQWTSLGDNMSKKKKFIDENKDAFKALGVEVNNVSDAENLLVTNKDTFIESIIAKSKAAAGMELASEKYKKAMEKMLEADKLADTVTITTSAGGGAGFGGGMTKTTVKNKTKEDLKKENADLLLEGDNLIKQSQTQKEKEADLLNKANIKKYVEDKKARTKATKEVYDAESEISKLILDIKDKRDKLLLDQQADSLQKRLAAIELEKNEEIRKIEEKEASIVEAYNKNHKGDKGFVAKKTVSEIDPVKGAELSTAKNNVTSAYSSQVVAETEKYGEELTALAMKFADERVKIAHDYNADIVKLVQNGELEAAGLATIERDKRVSEVTAGLIQETDLYKLATNDKLQASKETTEKLIADIKTRILAEQAAGKLSSETAKKMLADINSAQKTVAGDKIKNNPFAQLGASITGNTKAGAALKAGKLDPKTSKEDLAKLEDEAAKATASMAGAAGAALDGVQGILTSVVGGLDQLGLLTEEEKKTASDVIGMVSGAADVAKGIATANPVQIISGAVGLLTSAFSLFDKKGKDIAKKQKAIEANLNDLTAAYKRLQKAVEDALGTDVYKDQRESIQNLQAQIRANEAWIEQENRKKRKKRNQDAIADRKAEIEALKNEISDTADAIVEGLAQTNAKDLASQLGDALITAFGNGEDAALSMGNVVNDVMKNAVSHALKLQFLEKPMQKAVEQLAADMESGNELTSTEQSSFEKKIQDAGKLYYEQLSKYSNLFTGDTTAQTGIKGDAAKMTEETGTALTGQIIAMRLNIVAILATNKNAVDVMSRMLAIQEDIRTNTSFCRRLDRIDETLYYLKLNGIKVL